MVNLINLLSKKRVRGKSFFDYSAKDKKKIINVAARGSNRLQMELIKKYEKTYNFGKYPSL